MSEPDVLVVNASPVIFLGNAGRLELLRCLGASQVVVPAPVYDEVTSGGHADRAAGALTAATWLQKVDLIETPHAVVEWDLGPGESAVIATALQAADAWAVMDDLNGRKCDLALGLHVVGTLGIVVAAFRRGVVTDPRALLLELRAAGMWLSDALIARALRIAGIET